MRALAKGMGRIWPSLLRGQHRIKLNNYYYYILETICKIFASYIWVGMHVLRNASLKALLMLVKKNVRILKSCDAAAKSLLRNRPCIESSARSRMDVSNLRFRMLVLLFCPFFLSCICARKLSSARLFIRCFTNYSNGVVRTFGLVRKVSTKSVVRFCSQKPIR